MDYFSHSTTDSCGVTLGSKTLFDHIQGVSEKIKVSHSDKVDFGIEQDLLLNALESLAKFHDLGKFTTYFQDYLLKKQTVDQLLKQHARVGGIAAYNALRPTNEKLALICLYIIFRHHAQLNNTTDFTAVFDENLKRVFHLQKSNLISRINQIESVINEKDLRKLLEYPDEKAIRKGFKHWQIRENDIKDYFIVNYMFSLLIESDKLDASNTQLYIPKQIENNSVDGRFGKPKNIDITKDGISNNDIRNFCRAQVVSHLKDNKILDNKIFTLTAPTGIGKTMTALDFALKLKAILYQEKSINARIIYALPFINIIEQALKEYNQTLPKDVSILGHYQFADVFGVDKESSEDSEKNYSQKLMALDTWQSDIVITSFVQFFETLIGNRNKLLKKFNHFANSIVILDEVQTLRIEQIPLIGAAIYYLSKFLDARIILMTATKPKIFELAQREILDREKERVEPFELLTSHKEVFSLFKRTKIIPILNHEFDQENVAEDFVNEIFSDKWGKDKSCLIVCNTVNRSIEVFDAISNFLKENDLENPLTYLSTNIIPAHRFDRIKQLKDWLYDGKAPILVATQVVEAGVDLDFDMGFRDLGPIDSIVQVAGRINRNNTSGEELSPLYIINFQDARKIYGAITAAQSIHVLKGKDEIPENEYLQLVDNYFDQIAEKNSFARFNKIFESMKMLRYDSDDPENDMPISKFKIIEDSKTTKSVFVEFDDRATELRMRYMEKITGAISKEEFDKNFKLPFQQHIIALPGHLTETLSQINEFDTNILCLSNELISGKYNTTTGFLRKQTNLVVML